jgi:hypothetical protein
MLWRDRTLPHTIAVQCFSTPNHLDISLRTQFQSLAALLLRAAEQRPRHSQYRRPTQRLGYTRLAWMPRDRGRRCLCHELAVHGLARRSILWTAARICGYRQSGTCLD